MPKKTKHPGLRHHTRRGAGGQVRVYYYLDRRTAGEKDVPLGSNYTAALQRYKELVEDAPKVSGRVQEAINRWRIDPEVGIETYESPVTRRNYLQALKRIEQWCGAQRWEDITLPTMRQYLDRRAAKRQGNLEMSVLSIVWGRARLWGMTKLPFPAQGVKNWKNKERARRVEVTDALFNAIYERADQVLRDAMDIASATGLRLTDARTVELPVDGLLVIKGSSKKDKAIRFRVSASTVLPGIVERRSAVNADHPYLLSTPSGKDVSERMLADRWVIARAAAAERAEAAGEHAFAKTIRKTFLRDMRKRAAGLADTEDAAARLLQHDDKRITRKHYRVGGDVVDPVR